MKNFRLKDKFRAAVLAGITALGLMAGCTSNVPEERPPERQKTEWVADTNGRSVAPHQENGKDGSGNGQAQTPLMPVHEVKKPPSASHSGPSPAVKTDSVKVETIPAAPLEQAPANAAPDISLIHAPVESAPLQLHLPKLADTEWKFKLYASHAFTHYFPSDIRIKTSRYDVRIKDYEWLERGSREYFNPRTWFLPGNNPAQILDEPTNAYTFAMEKNAHVLFISAFHPKFYHDTNQIKHMQGTIDGVPVNGFAPVNKPFDGYNQSPGEMELVRNENTHLQMEWEIGYAHKFNLLSSPKFGTLSYVPGISAGVQMGRTYSVIIQKDKWWDFDDYTENYKIQGVGGSLRSKLEWTAPNERFGIFYENKAALYHRKHGLLDGTQEFNLRYTSNNFGMTFMIYNPNKKKPGGGPKL